MQKIVDQTLAFVFRHRVPVQTTLDGDSSQLPLRIQHPLVAPQSGTLGQRHQRFPLCSGDNCFTNSNTCASLNSRVGIAAPPRFIVADRTPGVVRQFEILPHGNLILDEVASAWLIGTMGRVLF